MKKILMVFFFLNVLSDCYCQPKMQGTIKPGITPKSIDIYLRSSASFSQPDEAMTFVIAIPYTILPAPSLGSSGVTTNGTGPVTGITGLQPDFLINNLNATSREVVVTKEKILADSFYVYTFIFAGTSSTSHSWTAGTEQLIFSIRFNGCTSNCNPFTEMLVNMPGGAKNNIAYWYIQPNAIGDITNYQSPFYANPQSGTPVNGGSNDGSALSFIGVVPPVVLPVILTNFTVTAKACDVNINWQSSREINADHYAMERSSNGIDFIQIGMVKAAANGATSSQYNFLDKTAVPGNNLYRLQLVNIDGSFTYSDIRSVNLTCTGKGSVLIYPKLSTGWVNVKLPSGQENARIRIIDIAGKEIGSNDLKTPERHLNLQAFANGTYIIQVLNNNEPVKNVKIVLQR